MLPSEKLVLFSVQNITKLNLKLSLCSTLIYYIIIINYIRACETIELKTRFFISLCSCINTFVTWEKRKKSTLGGNLIMKNIRINKNQTHGVLLFLKIYMIWLSNSAEVQSFLTQSYLHFPPMYVCLFVYRVTKFLSVT